MNRFVTRRSRLFLIVCWTFAASLSADAANLDDLFSSNYVVHDDDAACAPAGSLPSPDRTPPPSHGKSPSPPVRLILDQDSPSLAADDDTAALIAEFLLAEETPGAYRAVVFSDALHIRLRTLLI